MNFNLSPKKTNILYVFTQVFVEEKERGDKFLTDDDLNEALDERNATNSVLRTSIIGYPSHPLYKQIACMLQKWMDTKLIVGFYMTHVSLHYRYRLTWVETFCHGSASQRIRVPPDSVGCYATCITKLYYFATPRLNYIQLILYIMEPCSGIHN